MMYGAQNDKFDYHMVGFDEPILNYFLTKDGLYCDVQRVGSFNLFNDTRYYYPTITLCINHYMKSLYPFHTLLSFFSHLIPSNTLYHSQKHPLIHPPSELVYLNRKISLNMVAKKCGGGLNGDDFKIDHNASPYVPEK